MSVNSQSNAILSKHLGMPMKALWEALNDTAIVGPEVAMAIVNDPRCGIERRAVFTEGAMTNAAFDFTLNWEDGGATPLMLAALASRDDVMEALLSLNPEVDASEGKYGYAALHISARTNNISAIKLLLAKGSDVKAVSNIGDTPLHMAARNCNTEAVELMLGNGGDVMAVTKFCWTPLHYAVHFSKLESIELLIAKGSDVNAVDRDGWTPLHLAARNCNTESIELLVAKGSDVKAVIHSSRHTPLTEYEDYMGFRGVSDEAQALVRAMLA